MDKNFDEARLIARAYDIAEICERQYIPKAIGFLTPAEGLAVKRNFSKKDFSADLQFFTFGGFADAERKMFFALPEYADESAVWEFIQPLEITGRDLAELNHRDFLGSLVGLGIKREKLGDILCFEDRCIVFAAADIADYIISNLDKVGRCGISIRRIEPKQLIIPKRKFEEIRTTVPSLRLDAVVGAALKTSRSAAVEIIRQKRVAVNWQETDDTALKLKGGDVFSVRGKGRFRLTDEAYTTRKDRLGICIEKYI